MAVDEVVKMVAEKTGLPEDMARVAVELVVDYIKDKLPEPLAGQIDTIMSGEDVAGDLLEGLGGLLS